MNLSARRVLVIDDNEAIHADFRKILEPAQGDTGLSAAKAALFGTASATHMARPATRFRVDTAGQGQDGVRLAEAARAADDPCLVAFVDMRMPPGWDGLTTIEQLWRVDPRVQVVICTAYSDSSLEEIAGRLGVSDKLVILKKPFDNAEVMQLAMTLSEKWLAERSAERKVEDLERTVQERTAEIEHALLHDKLTGLPNRMLIQMRLEACIERQARNASQKFALLYLDFDRFKLINDSLGHEVGDLLLIEIANRLRTSLRGSDAVTRVNTPSRIGGDEFLVLLEDLHSEQDAARVAERLLTLISEPYIVSEQSLHLTASIGIATSEQRYTNAADLIRDADTAMYRAKAAGRARYVMFDGVMHGQVMARLSLEQALRTAVRSQAVDVHFQPIVSLATGAVSGFEALLRWSHPERGPVPAGELVALAEDTGLIQPLSLTVLRKACAQLQAWQAQSSKPKELMMSVNLSRRQLIDPDLVAKIAAIVHESGITPGTLILEITESTALDDNEVASQMLNQLRELGVWLHLDDFGTGYSSLSCLYRLPLSGIKIDRAFIKDVMRRPEHHVVLEAIVKIARAFRLQIVAEGVETTEQFELLRALQVDYAQGYLFGKAVNAEDTTALLGEPAPMIRAFEHAFGHSPAAAHAAAEPPCVVMPV